MGEIIIWICKLVHFSSEVLIYLHVIEWNNDLTSKQNMAKYLMASSSGPSLQLNYFTHYIHVIVSYCH